MNKRYRAFGVYIILIVVIAFLWMFWDGVDGVSREQSYSEVALEADLAAQNVSSIQIYQNREVPSGEVEIILKDSKEKKMYTADVNEVVSILREYGFENYRMGDVPAENWLISLLPMILSFALIFFFFMSHLFH